MVYQIHPSATHGRASLSYRPAYRKVPMYGICIWTVCVCVFAFRNALFLREIFRLHINLSMKTNYHVFLAIDQPSTGPDSSRIIQMHRIHKQTMSFKHLGPPNDLFVLQISLTQ